MKFTHTPEGGLYVAHRHLIKISGALLPVAAYERHCGTIVEQSDDSLNTLFRQRQTPRHIPYDFCRCHCGTGCCCVFFIHILNNLTQI